MRLNRSSILWLLALVASLPALLIAYLGQFSRLMGDDWCYFAGALHLGGRDYFGHWMNTWNGSYTYALLHDLLAPLGPEIMPPLFPALIFALWFCGLAWLFHLVLRSLQIRAHRMPAALTLALLTLAAVMAGLYDWEAIFWYAASTRHTLPVGVFLIYLAMSWEVSRLQVGNKHVAALALTGALICFLNGGLSELHSLLQTFLLTLLLAGVSLFCSRTRTGPCLKLLAAGWVGSGAGFLAQMLAPGAAARMDDMAKMAKFNQIRALPELIIETAETSAAFIGHQGNIAGFILLFAAGLVAALLLVRPGQVRSGRGPSTGKAGPGPAGAGARYRSAALLLGAFAMLALTQVAGLHFLASALLYIGALILLAVLAAKLAAATSDCLSRRLVLAAMCGSAFAYGSLALSIASGHFSIGIIYERTLTFAALLSVLSGLVWGGCLGFLIQRGRTRDESAWTRGMIGLGSLVAALLFLNILSLQAGLIPDFATYAREWDARHHRILQLRADGERSITVTPYSYHMTQAISPVDLEIVGWNCQPYYYGLESIRME